MPRSRDRCNHCSPSPGLHWLRFNGGPQRKQQKKKERKKEKKEKKKEEEVDAPPVLLMGCQQAPFATFKRTPELAN